ncbi:CopG family transcriptional regulator [candidate division KSB1 bacterium 4484_188]|nr:MAG: CopG family transcriptional regulator [candidate division KSB1 bacterium 4484_188]HFE64198.1 CopG family transcriptional regulator [Caldithrix sp.]
MSKTVTLRLKDEIYEKFRKFADADNRPISNFIETSVLRYIERITLIDEFEMAEIQANDQLKRSINQGLLDAKEKKGRFVE